MNQWTKYDFVSKCCWEVALTQALLNGHTDIARRLILHCLAKFDYPFRVLNINCLRSPSGLKYIETSRLARRRYIEMKVRKGHA